jgi:hypothetical protein
MLDRRLTCSPVEHGVEVARQSGDKRTITSAWKGWQPRLPLKEILPGQPISGVLRKPA